MPESLLFFRFRKIFFCKYDEKDPFLLQLFEGVISLCCHHLPPPPLDLFDVLRPPSPAQRLLSNFIIRCSFAESKNWQLGTRRPVLIETAVRRRSKI